MAKKNRLQENWGHEKVWTVKRVPAARIRTIRCAKASRQKGCSNERPAVEQGRRKELAIARREMMHRAKVAWRRDMIARDANRTM
jgi:hypothetical protein